MKKMLTGLLAITSLLAYADEAILEADFNTPGDFTLKNLGESLKSFTPTEGRISFPGKKAYLYHTTKNWQPKQWVRLNLVWTPAEKKMYVNGVLVASKKVTGNLQEIDSLELGAIDTYEPFQGVIDEFKVTAEPPAGLKESVPAKKTKRSSSPVFRASSAGLNG